jgi:hypothetical protein
MSKKHDILFVLILPINIIYHFHHKYLYKKNKANKF